MSTEDRLLRLERELSRAKKVNRLFLAGGLLALFVLACLGASPGPAQDVAKVIRAERFELVNSKGAVLGVFGLNKDQSGLILYDEKSNNRVAIMALNDETKFMLHDVKGQVRASMEVGDTAVMHLRDKAGVPKLMASVSETLSGLSLFSGAGGPRAGLLTGRDGPALKLWDKNGETRAVLTEGDQGPVLLLADHKSMPRAALGLAKEGAALRFADERATTRVGIGMTDDGPGLMLNDHNGKTIWSAPR